jgi:hypothetical protein
MRRTLHTVVIGAMLLINALGTVTAASLPRGITPQFNDATDIPRGDDDALIEFLVSLSEGGTVYGYSTYWVSYRIAFLSSERVILSPGLPYRYDLVPTDTDRYPAYTAEVRSADRVVLVTANLPPLNEAIRQKLMDLGLAHQEQSIGAYTVFYNLPRHITPDELGF